MIHVFFKTYGCQANVADSQDFATHLEKLGAVLVSREIDADLIIVNTCAIRKKAEQKIYSYLGDLVSLRQDKPYLKIGVVGCIASYRKKEIFERFDHMNFVFGAREKPALFHAYLARIVPEIHKLKKRFLAYGMQGSWRGRQDRNIEAFVHRTPILNIKNVSEVAQAVGRVEPEVRRSMINITSGCNNYCSYCIVPFTRGRERSYPFDSILERVRGDVEAGAREVTLIGQNVNSYQDPNSGSRFPELLDTAARIDGDFWIRFISPHPKDITRELVDVMAAYPEKLCSYIHFPLQSGSTCILKAMNRTYTAEQYMEKVAMIKKILPNVTLTTDIIVGFPGETEEDFRETMKIVEAVRFDLIYSFIYSPRKYTKAAAFPDDCFADEKLNRLEELQARGRQIACELHEGLIGSHQRVLVERRLKNGKLLARTSGNVRVNLDGPDQMIWQFVDVEIKGAHCTYVDAVVCN